jgi:hypothetical protein
MIVVMMLAGPLCAWGWVAWDKAETERRNRDAAEEFLKRSENTEKENACRTKPEQPNWDVGMDPKLRAKSINAP